MKVVIEDGNNLAYRCFHSTVLETSYGVLTNILYGCLNSVLFHNHRLRPDAIVFVWDSPGSRTWRRELFPGYKAHRDLTRRDESFSEQVNLLKQTLAYVGIPSVDSVNTEADDVIGYLSNRYAGEGHESVIVSSDGDFYQLMTNPSIRVFHPNREFMTPEEDPKYGVKASQIVAYKALVGDDSDEYRGVDRVGQKTALKFFEGNQNLTDLADLWNGKASFHTVTPLIAKKLITSRSDIEMCSKLATLDLERGCVDLPAFPAKNMSAFSAICEEYEFNTFVKRKAEFEGLPNGSTL